MESTGMGGGEQCGFRRTGSCSEQWELRVCIFSPQIHERDIIYEFAVARPVPDRHEK